MDTKEKLTTLFGISWRDVETIEGESGKMTYFIGRIALIEY